MTLDWESAETALSAEVYVYSEPKSLSIDNDDMYIQKQLQVIALEKTIIFIPKDSIALIPKGSTLLVIKESLKDELSGQLAAKEIAVVSAREWLKMSREALNH